MNITIAEALRRRRAVRNFQAREVETEKIEKLLEAATSAPNDRLREPWHFYVVRGEAKERYTELALAFLQERFPTKPELIEASMTAVRNTPLLIIVASDIVPGDAEASEDNEYAVACAIHSMWLAADELGLGMVWRTRGVGLVRDERLHRFIGATEGQKIIATLCVGYPEGEAAPTKRTPFTEKTTWL
ncbi:putative NAD(P)H nitroreductase YfhC [Paenibacillus tyrfis]|nr:putative NAD(P)H nitroreductase YfhC [Paenibacillus tyrfis]